MTEIKLPHKLDLNNSLQFCNKLWELQDDDSYDFNFANLDFTEPFTMIYVANEIKRFANEKKSLGAKFTASGFEEKSYPAHMGFFKAFGLDHGKEPGEANGSSTYIPITILKIDDLKQEAINKSLHIGDLLEEKSEELAKILTRQKEGNLVDTLTFSIREIMRNVVEHSNSDIIEYCAQFWPGKHLVEVAILDTGDGIMKGLSSNPYLKIEKERDALHQALLPGISGKMYKGVKKRKNNPWQNSGYGLYMTNRICREGGSFTIISNGAGLILDHGYKVDKEASYQGTALRLQINTDNIADCSSMLKRFRDEGSEISKELKTHPIIEASMASTMLAKDFKRI